MPYLAGILDVDVVDEFAQQPEVLLTAHPQQGLLLIVLHLHTDLSHQPPHLYTQTTRQSQLKHR